VIVPLVGDEARFETVSEYVVLPEVSCTSIPFDLLRRRSGTHSAVGTAPGTSGVRKVLRPPLKPVAS
jgi:hypothetical protein